MSANAKNDAAAARSDVTLIRLAILVTALAVVLGLTLLIKETAYLFTGFMVLGPGLLGLGAILLVVVILRELRARRVL